MASSLARPNTDDDPPLGGNCNSCKNMTIEKLCRPMGYQHAASLECLLKFQSFCGLCQLLAKAIILDTSDEMASSIQKAREASRGDGIRLHLERSLEGTMLEMYQDGARITPNGNPRGNIYVTCCESRQTSSSLAGILLTGSLQRAYRRIST